MFRGLIRALVPRSARNILRNPSATTGWLRDELSFRLGRVAHVQMADGWVARCHPATEAVFKLVETDEFRQELASFLRYCTSGMVLFDVGANFGVFTLAAIHQGGPNARVIAVEPSQTAVRYLRINVGLAQAGERVRIVQGAVGGHDGSFHMIDSGPYAHFYAFVVDEPHPDAREITQYTLGTLAQQMVVLPTHIKIDIEGDEVEAISGAQDFLDWVRPIVFLELHNAVIRQRGKDPEHVLRMMERCGYARFEHYGCAIAPADATGPEIIRLVCLPG
jgi:FkbM family methyltransferase